MDLYTKNSFNLCLILSLIIQAYLLWILIPRISKCRLKRPSTCPLRLIKLNNACPPCITATAGTGLVRTSYLDYSHYLHPRNGFTAYQPSFTHWTSHGPTFLSSLPMIPHCRPQREFRYLFTTRCGWSFFQTN